MNRDKLEQLIEYVEEDCFTDGSHHKQWYLFQIAKILHNEGLLDIDINDVDEGIAP